ncbi:MAG: hypothetical protein ACLP9L_10240 [Thermoguttaceae bacterium]
MGYAGCWADVMKWGDIKEIVPAEAAAFEEHLQVAGVDMDAFCQAMMWQDLNMMEVAANGEDAAREAIGAAWRRLADSFTQATTVDGAGLVLTPDYHDPENGDRYDEVRGGYFVVAGVYQPTAAGRKFAKWIERVSFVEFG